jgi:O-antigen/teichoic acid export membrane protein
MTPKDVMATFRRILFRPSMAYLATSALSRVGSLLLVPFYTRSMSAESYGDYVLVLTILTLGPAFVLGLPDALTRSYFIEKDPKAASARYGGVAKLLICFTLVMFLLAEVIIISIAKATDGLTSRYGLSCINIATTGTTLGLIPIQYSRARQRPIGATVFQTAEFMLTVGLGITLTYALHRGLRGALETLALTYGVLGAASAVYAIRLLRGSMSISLLRQSLAFSMPYVPHFLAVWIQGVAERWALKFAHLETALGHYAIASQLVGPVSMISASWNLERSATMGEIYRDGGATGLAQHLRRITTSYLIVTMVPSTLILICMPLAPMLLGNGFHDILYYIPIFLMTIIVDAGYCPANLVAYYTGHSSRIAGTTVLSAGVAICGSLLFVPFLGINGALLTRVLSVTVRAGVMWYAARQCLLEGAGRTEVA